MAPRKQQINGTPTAARAQRRAATKAAPKKVPTKHVVRPKGTAERITELEKKLETVIWLHAEMSYSLRLAVAKSMAKAQAAQQESKLVEQIMAKSQGLGL